MFRPLLLAALLGLSAPAFAQPAPPKPIPGPVSTTAGCLIQSDFLSNGRGNFETVVLQGNDLVHYWHDNGNVQHTPIPHPNSFPGQSPQFRISDGTKRC